MPSTPTQLLQVAPTAFSASCSVFWFCQNRIIYLHEMTEKAARKKAGPEFGILPGVPRLQKGVADKNNGIAKKENERSKCKSGKAAALFQKQENPGRKQNPGKSR